MNTTDANTMGTDTIDNEPTVTSQLVWTTNQDTARILSRIRFDSNDRCWEWGSDCQPLIGYPQTWINGKPMLVRRFMALLFLGHYDRSMKATCRNYLCVNPYHFAKSKRG